MKIKISLSAILLLLCSAQIVFAQEKTQTEQKKVLICSDCLILGKPLFVPQPEYPKEARASNASGTVKVQITIDEKGNVIEAKAVSGDALLFEASVAAALKAKFTPALTIPSKNPAKSSGILTYNFVLDEQTEARQTEIKKSGRIVDLGGGTVTGKAIKLSKPTVPFCNCSFGSAKSVSTVLVQAEIDEQGNISKATAISGHPLLKRAGERAARKSKFTPSLIDGERVKGKALIVYKFLSVNKWSIKPLKVTVQKIELENKSTN